MCWLHRIKLQCTRHPPKSRAQRSVFFALESRLKGREKKAGRGTSLGETVTVLLSQYLVLAIKNNLWKKKKIQTKKIFPSRERDKDPKETNFTCKSTYSHKIAYFVVKSCQRYCQLYIHRKKQKAPIKVQTFLCCTKTLVGFSDKNSSQTIVFIHKMYKKKQIRIFV